MASRDYGEILGWSRVSDGVFCIEEGKLQGSWKRMGKIIDMWKK